MGWAKTRGTLLRASLFCPLLVQDASQKHSMKCSLALKSLSQPVIPSPEEESHKVPELSALPSPQEGLALSNGCMALSFSGQPGELPSDKQGPSSPSRLPRGQWRDAAVDSPAVNSCPMTDKTPLKLCLPGGPTKTMQEQPERAFRRQGTQPVTLR